MGGPTVIGELIRELRLRRYSYRTEQAYVGWVRRYLRFHRRHPRELGAAEVRAFLTHLVERRRVSASTQSQALSALVFLYREVLRDPVGWIDGLARSRRPKQLPVVLTRDEVRAVLGRMRGTTRLMAMLLYGSGLRLHREDGAVFVVASKRHPDSRDRRPLLRRSLTWGFNTVLSLATGYPGRDTHGLKSIDGRLARQLCHQCQTTDEVFQTELVLLAWRLGHPIHEVPIALGEVRPTPVRLRRRMPLVAPMLAELRASLGRFPAGAAGRVTQVARPG